jgi:hypothetical protein
LTVERARASRPRLTADFGMRTLVNLRFEKGDPVCEYWLARGEGFVVETRNGRVVGEVLDSVFDPERQRVVGLVVREKVLGTVPGAKSEVSADRIAAAVPGREAFVLDGAEDASEPSEPKPRRLAPAARAAGNGAATAAKAAGTGAAGAAKAAGSGAAAGARRLAVVGAWFAAMWHAVLPVLRAAGAAIVTWVLGFAAWMVAAGRALAAEAQRELHDLRDRRSPPRQ